MQTNDSGLATYVADQIDWSLNWKVSKLACPTQNSCKQIGIHNLENLNRWFDLSTQDVKWLQTITNLPILVKGVLTAEDGRRDLAEMQNNVVFHILF